MSKRKVSVFLIDIVVSILKIQNTIKIFNFQSADELYKNYIAWDSVIREFEVIGEATNKLIKEKIFGEDKRVVVDFRNILIHQYFGVDPEEVWDIIQNDLESLKNDTVNQIIKFNKEEIVDALEEYIKTLEHLEFAIEYLNRLLSEIKNK